MNINATSKFEQCRDISQALLSIQNASIVTPKRSNSYLKQAEIYMQMCDYPSAIISYRQYFSTSRSHSREVAHQFANLLNLYGFELLRHSQQRIIGTIDDRQVQTCLIEAVLCDRVLSDCEGNSDSPLLAAVNHFTESIDLSSAVQTYLRRGLAYCVLKDYDKALQDIDHCILLNNENVSFHKLREKISKNLEGKPSPSRISASTTSPEDARIPNHQDGIALGKKRLEAQAATCILLEQFEEAVEILGRTILLTSTDPMIYKQRSIAYQKLGKNVEALQDAECALRLAKETEKNDENVDEGRSNDIIKELEHLRIHLLDDVVQDLLACKKYQSALDTLNKCITHDRYLASKRSEEKVQRSKFYIQRGDAYQGLGNLQPALADYRKANEITPESREIKSRTAFIHYNFGIDLFNKARFEEAELEFDRAIKMDPFVGAYHSRKGDAARFMQKHFEAFENYREALRLNPTDKECIDKIQPYMMASNGTISAKKKHAPEVKNQQWMQQKVTSKSSEHLAIRQNHRTVRSTPLNVVKRPL
ncbi:unnamed protein product [Albugo candida]|nr:unnamed protein product [Albugo candida]|eukprot:CCI39760.1 unnamed protein product [Albugo candida]